MIEERVKIFSDLQLTKAIDGGAVNSFCRRAKNDMV